MQGGWNPQGPGAPPDPSQQGGYGQQPQQPPQQGGYPQQGNYPSQATTGGYPPQPQGFPPGQQGYPPASGGAYRQPGAMPTGPLVSSFVQALFDFSFTTFVTTKVLKVLYGLLLTGAVLMFLAADYNALNRLTSSYSYGKEEAMMTIIASPFALLFAVVYARIVCEMIAVAFRIAENLAEINRKTKE